MFEGNIVKSKSNLKTGLVEANCKIIELIKISTLLLYK